MGDAELVDLIYDTAVDAGGWHNLAPTLAAAFSSPSAQISLVPRHGEVQRLSSTANYHPAIDAQYTSYFHRIDRFVQIGRSQPPGTPIVSSDFMADSDFANSEHYRDYCRHLEIFYCFGLLLNVGEESQLALGLHRDFQHPFEVTAADRARLRRIGRHVARAHRVSRMATQKSMLDGLAGLFERLRVPALVLDNTMRVHRLNAAAETIIARCHDAITIRNRRLGIADARALARLRDHLDRLAAGRAPAPTLLGLHLLQGEITRTLTFEALPLPRQWSAGRAGETRILLLIHALDAAGALPAPSEALAAALRDLYGLTLAESRLACAFGTGRTIAEISAANGIAPNTTRHHLKQIFAKMNCHRQSDIVRIVHRFSLGPG